MCQKYKTKTGSDYAKKKIKEVLGLLCEVSDFVRVECMPMEDMMDAGNLHVQK
jgi:hypothetical protein